MIDLNMIPSVINTEDDYNKALEIMEQLIDLDPENGTKEAKLMDTWGILINNYEEKMYPIDLPDPIEAIKFRMDQMGLKQKDMTPYLGSVSKVSEVLNRKRTLTLNMMRKLRDGLNIPAEVLLNDRVSIKNT